MKTAPMEHTQTNSYSGHLKYLITLFSSYMKYLHRRNFYTRLTVSIYHTWHVSKFPVLSTHYIFILLVNHSFLPHSATTPPLSTGTCHMNSDFFKQLCFILFLCSPVPTPVSQIYAAFTESMANTVIHVLQTPTSLPASTTRLPLHTEWVRSTQHSVAPYPHQSVCSYNITSARLTANTVTQCFMS
jgi:hypothetical protein